MKKISVTISAIIILWACNNNTAENSNSRDSLQNTGTDTLAQPPAGSGQDNNKDTAMYQRMPLKTSDSIQK